MRSIATDSACSMMNPDIGVGNGPRIMIRPASRWRAIDVKELWQFRELLWILVLRDIKVRYKQTYLGIAWTVIQPVTAMLIFTLFFGKLAKLPSGDVPYSVFCLTALLPWQFFSKALTEASTSLVVSERIITKVYFPRILIPTAVVLAGLLDFSIATLVLSAMMLSFGIVPTAAVLALPLLIAMVVLAALAVSYWLSALDVQFRDVRYTLPFLTQIWLFATPVVYSSQMVPERWRALYGLNPMVGVIETFRWSLLGAAAPDAAMLAVSILTIVAAFVGGVFFFRSMERTMADLI